MALSTLQKKRVTKNFKKHDNDTGSGEVQVALLTAKISKLMEHLKKNPKDKHSRRGLLGMVSQRKKMLKFLKNNEPETFEKVTTELKLKA